MKNRRENAVKELLSNFNESVEIFNREHEEEYPLQVTGGYAIFNAKGTKISMKQSDVPIKICIFEK